jgi:putative alpha-1,2-mannosidase
MLIKRIFGLILIALLLLTTCLVRGDDGDNSKWVDPFIGVDGDGNVVPGATLPFGMVKLSPDCSVEWLNSGYASDKDIIGFSHTHVSGTGGGPKYGNILVMA